MLIHPRCNRDDNHVNSTRTTRSLTSNSPMLADCDQKRRDQEEGIIPVEIPWTPHLASPLKLSKELLSQAEWEISCSSGLFPHSTPSLLSHNSVEETNVNHAMVLHDLRKSNAQEGFSLVERMKKWESDREDFETGARMGPVYSLDQDITPSAPPSSPQSLFFPPSIQVESNKTASRPPSSFATSAPGVKATCTAGPLAPAEVGKDISEDHCLEILELTERLQQQGIDSYSGRRYDHRYRELMIEED